MAVDRRNFLKAALTAGVVTAGDATLHAQQGSHPQSATNAPDWLLDPSPYKAAITRSADGKDITLSNGLVRRIFRLAPNAATIALDNLVTGESQLRGVRAEAVLTINGYELEVGGLQGQPVNHYFSPAWLAQMTADPRAFTFDRVEEGKPVERFPWKRVQKWSTVDLPWPPPGVALTFHYKPGAASPLKNIAVRVHYELYDGLPVMAKWVTVENNSDAPIVINRFKAEILALVESSVTRIAGHDNRALLPRLSPIHIETDYAFGGTMSSEHDNVAVQWTNDPLFHPGQGSTVLECTPPVGPEVDVAAGETWTSFNLFELLHDSTEEERRGLALRKMMTTLAPWSQENPLYMHIRYAEVDKVKMAIDQCAAVGFEAVMLSYGSGFDIENDDPKYMAQMKEIADYAKQRDIAIGGYTLLASRGGDPKDLIIDVKTGVPGGGTFGPSPCLCSEWADKFFRRVHTFLAETGMNIFLNDGSYPGDYCASTHHPGHKGYLDSQWKQWKVITTLYRWCREQGYYLKVPDWYFLNGANKTGMAYNENDFSLPREYQTVIERQDIYDGTFNKTPSMAWMHVPLVEYHGGGEAATVEPLEKNLAHYEMRFADLLGAGVQATWRGTRLFDSDTTMHAVKKWVDFFKANRAILCSDIIHLRRPDGSDWDGILHVNPGLNPRGLAFLYNPLDVPITREISLPLYYTGLTDSVKVQERDGAPKTYHLDRAYKITVSVTLPARGCTWLFLRS